MQQVFDYDDDYSTEYLIRFNQAVAESRNFGFTRDPFVSRTGCRPARNCR